MLIQCGVQDDMEHLITSWLCFCSKYGKRGNKSPSQIHLAVKRIQMNPYPFIPQIISNRFPPFPSIKCTSEESWLGRCSQTDTKWDIQKLSAERCQAKRVPSTNRTYPKIANLSGLFQTPLMCSKVLLESERVYIHYMTVWFEPFQFDNHLYFYLNSPIWYRDNHTDS